MSVAHSNGEFAQSEDKATSPSFKHYVERKNDPHRLPLFSF